MMCSDCDALEARDGQMSLLDGIGFAWLFSAILDMHGGEIMLPENVLAKASNSYQVGVEPGGKDHKGMIVVTKIPKGQVKADA